MKIQTINAPTIKAMNRGMPKAIARGFTLIEMVMVIALIGIVMGVVGNYAFTRFTQGKYDAGKLGVRSLAGKVEIYIVQNGSPPQSLNDLVTRPGNAQDWTGPYAKDSDLKDPFGHPYLYKVPGEHGDFDLTFLGKDGAPGGDGLNKDFGNWQ
ncbi:MAG TPA: type II secretion system major pseudopilin GspG [Rudaea sp.]|jgi:general secretion pathway protein G|nr:type II secretion system major pseudopilin GspG [Rudaea sp.]